MRRRAFTATRPGRLAAPAAPPRSPRSGRASPCACHPLPARGPSTSRPASSWTAPPRAWASPSCSTTRPAPRHDRRGVRQDQAVDNHTFLTTTTAMVCITRHLQPIPFDPDKDFVTVSRMCTSWGIFAIHPSVPARTVAEFWPTHTPRQPGQDQLRLVGARHHHPPVRRDAAARGLHQDDPRALSRQRTGHQRPGRGRGLGPVRPDLPAAREGGQAHRARHAVERPPSPTSPRCPTLREAGYRKEEGDILVRHPRPHRHVARCRRQAREGDRRCRALAPTSSRSCISAAATSPT